MLVPGPLALFDGGTREESLPLHGVFVAAGGDDRQADA